MAFESLRNRDGLLTSDLPSITFSWCAARFRTDALWGTVGLEDFSKALLTHLGRS